MWFLQLFLLLSCSSVREGYKLCKQGNSLLESVFSERKDGEPGFDFPSLLILIVSVALHVWIWFYRLMMAHSVLHPCLFFYYGTLALFTSAFHVYARFMTKVLIPKKSIGLQQSIPSSRSSNSHQVQQRNPERALVPLIYDHDNATSRRHGSCASVMLEYFLRQELLKSLHIDCTSDTSPLGRANNHDLLLAK